MKSLLAGLVIIVLAGAAYAQAPKPEAQERPAPLPDAQNGIDDELFRRRPDPSTNDIDRARRSGPEEAPPGKLCLFESPDRCAGEAKLIRKPYEGEGQLYYLEKRPATPR